MQFTVKTKSSDIYGALIRLYPQSFRKHYSATMKQTFADMLKAEQSFPGKFNIWLRALVDLPLSAMKEHLTKGRHFTMHKNIKILIVGAIVAIGIVGLASFWGGIQKARDSIVVERVSTAQLADAMQQDNFYSTYGNAAVLFSSKVKSTEIKDNATFVTFDTGRPYSVVCDLPSATTYKTGQTLSIAAPAGSAERLAQGVLLHGCVTD